MRSREAAAQRRLSTYLEKSSAAALLTLPPPSKGHDLPTQHHILSLNFRHVQAELQRKALAIDGLVKERDALQKKVTVLEETQVRIDAHGPGQEISQKIGAFTTMALRKRYNSVSHFIHNDVTKLADFARSEQIILVVSP